MMTRKDYAMLAEVIRSVGTHGGDRGTLLHVVTRLRPELEADNPHFDFERFSDACGFYLRGGCGAVD
jgi:hypothetical protein